MNKGEWAQKLLNSNAVILDTETTGGAKTDQIIQLSIVDMTGRTLFDSLLRPTCAINPFAAKVHNLTERHLRNAPPFADVYEVVKSVLNERTVIAYNAPFDKRQLIQTATAFKLDADWIERLDWQCAMRAHAEYLGVKQGPGLEGGDHSALGDCLATLKLIRSMAGASETPKVQPVAEKPISPAKTFVSGPAGCELLTILAPPLDLVDWLGRVFEAKQAKGEPIPAEYERWLQVWRDIRGAGESVVDGTKPETWAQVFEILMQARKELAF
jgi:DNA polymerase-3 subunit epsilon